jgi:sorting nexin-8
MFDRRDKYAKDNIPQLEKRIANNESKLGGIRNKSPDQVKPGEAEKVEDAIFKVSLIYSFLLLLFHVQRDPFLG